MPPSTAAGDDAEPAGAFTSAIITVSRTQRALLAIRLRDSTVRPEQAAVMRYLWRSGPVRQAVLGAEFHLDSASTTRVVQRLEAVGLLRRDPDPADRRATLVSTTDEAASLREHVERAWDATSATVALGFTDEERTMLLDLLGRVHEHLRSAIADEA